MKHILYPLLLGLVITMAAAQPRQPVVLKMGPVTENADMDNPWEIEQHLPGLWIGIIDTLDGFRFAETSPPATFALHTTIHVFDISKYHMGNPLVGGYQGYKAKLQSDCSLIRLPKNREVARWRLNTELSGHQLGFTVLAQGIKHALTFQGLDTLKFDSPAFQQSLVYRTLVLQGQALRNKLADYFGLEVSQQEGLGPYQVLISRGGDIHINAGSAEGLVKDQMFSVYMEGAVILDESGAPLGRETVLVGRVRVMAVKGNHLAWLQFTDPSVHVPKESEIFLQ
ncbi:MAG: hypothetical protein K9N34_03595 [Candidatus Marinimicrobia bacterium]|nr:hypothetical protein [Candidatus Neomarinimicrobiota bacterium]MCF7839950.1 hypothetical protein [Candidatus Neomarinimicrobiota bacterium]